MIRVSSYLRIILITLWVAFAAFGLLSGTVHAQPQSPSQQVDPGKQSENCAFDAQGNELCNPIDSDNLRELFVSLTKLNLAFVGLAAILMIVISGVKMIFSGGNETALKSAKATLTWSVLGLIVAVMAYSIVTIILNLLRNRA